jgi:hypothetical protein
LLKFANVKSSLFLKLKYNCSLATRRLKTLTTLVNGTNQNSYHLGQWDKSKLLPPWATGQFKTLTTLGNGKI